jgi:RimJ/RimL family protein N-acetyltransferase
VRLERDNLTIRDAVLADAPLFGSWWRDGALMAHAGFPLGLDITDEQAAKQIASCSDDTYRLLVLEIDGVPKGELNYHSMGCKTVQTGIYICDASLRDRGYGTKALLMLMSELFGRFERIILDVSPDNKRACHVYEKLGFKKTQPSGIYTLNKIDFINDLRYNK